MATSCTIRPQVKAPNGDIVDSKLFVDMRKELPYEEAKELYLRATGSLFAQKYADSNKVQYDENGEPTYNSLKHLPEFQDILTYSFRKGVEEKKVKAHESKPATRENIDMMDQRAINYNSTADLTGEFLADTEIFTDNDGIEKVHVVIKPNTKENRDAASEISRKKALNLRLRSMLAELGISVGTLNELEEKMRIAGVTDFEAAQLTASGMYEIIRLAKDQAGEDALPEEFSHLILEALKDNSIVQRLHNTIADNNLAQAILGEDYERYVELYDNDAEKLATEAMGTLVARHILAQIGLDKESVSGYENAKNLISRMINAFKGKFSQQDEMAYMQALKEAEETAGEFAQAILNSNLYQTADITNITSSNKYYEVKEDVEKKKLLLNELCENMARRYAILESRSNKMDKTVAEVRMKALMEKFNLEKYEEGIYEFLDATLNELAEIEKDINDIKEHPESFTLAERSNRLKRAKDFIRSYESGISAIQEGVRHGVINPNSDRRDTISKVSSMVAEMLGTYEDLANASFVEFIKSFIGDGIEIPYGKMKGKIYKAEDLAKRADHDIGFFDRWLDSMANSSDFVLRMMDSTVKNAKGKARMSTLRIKERIDDAYSRLRKAGVKDTKFMYERIDGKRTFRYIRPEDADKLPLAQRNYYYEVMEIKDELDHLLPDNATKLNNIIRIRKDLIDRMRIQGTPKGAIHEVIGSIKDSFLRNSDDTMYGGQQRLEEDENKKEFAEKNILMDFEGHQVEKLPIYYINSRPGEDPENISDDMNSTLLLYAQMCNNYAQMNEVLSTLELVRDRMRERNVQQREGTKALHSIVRALGLVKADLPYTKKGEATHIVQKMNDWFSSQVYGKYMKDEGEILGIDTGKLANNINAVTAINTFALNILSGISNVMTGSAMMRIERASGQFFNARDVTKADLIFSKEMPKYLSEVGARFNSSKLALFDEKFNVLQDFESDLRETDYNKSRARRLFKTNALYVINNAGELWMQNRTALALANAYKLKDKLGNEISLWDALYVDDKGEVPRLLLKDGVTKTDGTAFTDADIIAFTNKSKGINQRMHGIYNYEDRNAWQATAIGKMCLMFRKWIRPNLQMKYGSLRYNYDLQTWEEGYWKTIGRFIMQLRDDLKAGQLDIMASWRQRSPEEKANWKKAMWEVGQFLMCAVAFGLLSGVGDGDDDDDRLADSWWFQQLKYQLRRLETELGATMPIAQMPKEALTILKSPAAGINTIEDLLNLTKLIMPHHIIGGIIGSESSIYNKRLQSGRYKNRTWAHKYIWESPFAPIIGTVRRGLNPKESLKYFTQQ